MCIIYIIYITHRHTRVSVCYPSLVFCAITQTPETGYITKNGKVCHKITVLAHLMSGKECNHLPQ